MAKAPIIRIGPVGDIGNQMFQYMLALAIRASRPDASILGHDMPMWGLTGSLEGTHPSVVFAIHGHRLPLQELISLVQSVDDIEVTIATLSARYAYYRDHLDLFRHAFAAPEAPPSHASDQIVISVRLGDIANGSHPNYFPLPLSFYRRVIAETGLRPIFMGQLDDGPYTAALRAQFPTAEFIPSMGPAKDFAFIRNSTNIVPSISTFSWLASWLSESAQSIYFPIAGFYHPGHRPDLDLLPLGDARYRFFLSDMGSWRGLPDYPSLISDDHTFKPASHGQLRRTFKHLGTDGFQRPRRSFRWLALLGL